MTMQWKDEPMTTCGETPDNTDDRFNRESEDGALRCDRCHLTPDLCSCKPDIVNRGSPGSGLSPSTRPIPFRGDRDSVNAPGNSEDTAAQAMQDAQRDRQKKITTLMRSALGHIEDAVDLAPDYTPEGVQLRQFAASLDNLTTDIERRTQS